MDICIDKFVTAAHKELINRFIRQEDGLILNYADLDGKTIIPSAEECRMSKPNAMGWNTPIEDGPFYNALYLDSLCNKYLIYKDNDSEKEAQQIARGLVSLAIDNGRKGFIARGFSNDRKSFYIASSDDQVFPWFYGLWRYLKSGIAREKERIEIIETVENVAAALSSCDFAIPCAELNFGYRGSFKRQTVEDISRLLFILRAMYDITLNKKWLISYENHLNAVCGSRHITNLSVCSNGSEYKPYEDNMVFFPRDKKWLIEYGSSEYEKNGSSKIINCINEIFGSFENIIIDEKLPFFTTSMVQLALRGLVEMEENTEISSYFRKGLLKSAKNAATHIKRYKGFDNNNALKFDINWRFLNEFWKHQNDITDTHILANNQLLEWYLKSPKTVYENNYVREPLFAAWITALSGDKVLINDYKDDLEQILEYYNWDKLYTSTFFTAECIFYQIIKDHSLDW